MPPVVAAVAVVGAGAAAAAGVITVGTALAVGAVAIAATSLLNKPPMPTVGAASTSPAERKQVIRSAASPMVGIVGTSQISGVLTFAEEVKDKDELNMVVALAGHTKPAGQKVVQSVNKVMMDDEEIPLGLSHGDKVYVRVYDGSQNSINDIGSELRNLPSWRNDMVGKGVCFAHIRCRYDQELFPSGLPNFVFELDGTGSVSLSSDAVLNYLRNNFNAADDEIDFASFNVARSICAETISNGNGGTEPRYMCDGSFNYSESHKQIIDKMRVTCAGQLTYINGKFGLRVGAYNGPADFVLTEKDIIGDVSVKPQPDRRSLINTCKGKHVWPDAKFQEVDFPKIQSEPMLAEDGEELEKDLNLEFCHSPYQCQRLAANDITRARLPVITVPCNMRAFECFLGRNIKLHIPTIGYEYKECVVEGWALNPENGVTLTLREDGPTVWTDIVGRVPILPPDVNLPSPKECRPVSNIVLAELEVDGVWESRITWDHPHSASVYKYRVVLEKSVNASWVEKFNGDVASRFFVISNPVSGDYRISITAVNRFDVSSSAVVKSLSMNVPEIMLVGIAATVDNSIYPATALVIGDVEGIDSFPANSIIYETETKSGASQWLPAGKGTAPSSRLTGLDEGQHDIRMRAVPPFGEPSQWHQTQITVFSVEQPSQLTFTPDSTLNHWGQLSWSGAGQSWEVEVRQSTQLLRTQENALWHSTTTDHKIWLNWQPPGDYVITVRSRAGQLASEWSEINVEVADLLPPTDLSFTGDDSGSTGGLVSWQSADERMEMCELELLNDQGEVLHTAVTGSPQAIIPVLAPGEYSALVRCRWREHLSTWASLVITVTDSVSAPSDLKFSTTGETAWQGELIWNPYGLPSELEIINTNTTETVLSLTLLSGYHHLSLLPVGSYQARVRTIGTWSQSPWISTTIVVGQPDTPDNLQYRETPDNVTTAGQLYWEGSTSAGVSGYDVVITDSNSATVLATRVQSTWLDIGNIANGQFTAQVRAVSLLAAEFSDWISTSFTVSPLASPINLSAVEKLVETGTGFTSQITLKWQANDTRTQSYDVEFRLVSVTAWGGLYSGPSNTASRNGLTAGDYRFRVRAINGGMESGWVETSLTVRGIETAPDDITGLQLSGLTGELAQLTWDPITSVDVINGGSVQVKHSPKIGSAVNWATANSIWERLPGNTSMVTVPLLTGTYLVKAVNPADFWSVNAALVESNMASLKGYNRVVERDESDGWPGEKNKAVIDVGGSLTLSETQENSDPPYYIMESPLDLGALFTVRLHLECDGTVYERDTIDDRTDPIDNWEMFDGAQAGGTGLQYQVSTTNDDPADAAATWTDWTQFFVGDFRARAFKLRIVLANPTPSAAGTLNGLRLVADVPDRTETHTGVSAPGNGLPVSYKTPFLAPAMVAITAHGMTTGDYYRITNSTAAGFTIRFYNSSGSGIARDFDFVAVSYGEG